MSNPKTNLLVSYPYVNPGILKLLLANESRIRFLLDSGAFTAWKAGKTISLDDYCSFIEKLPITPWRYFTLDVIGNPDATRENYEKMIARGFSPVPIFTRGESLSQMDKYYETSDVVGIGGLVGTPQNRGFVKAIMNRTKGKRVHLLGFTDLDFLKFFKPYMADSSSWECGARYGQTVVYLGNGKAVNLRRANLKTLIADPNFQFSVRRLGIEPLDLLNQNSWKGGRSVIRRLGARSYVSLSQDLEVKNGTHLFLAGSTDLAISLLLGG